MLRILSSVALLFGACQFAFAQGGPPLITDDPGTPGNGKWEIILSTGLEKTDNNWRWEAPLLDVNYGLGDHIQLKFEVPWVVLDEESQGARAGIGNSLVGCKWRFLDAETHGLDMSLYPQLELNNSSRSAERGLVEDGSELLLPIEIGKNFGKLKLAMEAGLSLVEHGNDRFIFGLAAAYPISRQLELTGEVHMEADEDFDHRLCIVNLGARYELSDVLTLLLSAGHGWGDNKPDLLAFAGIQFNF